MCPHLSREVLTEIDEKMLGKFLHQGDLDFSLALHLPSAKPEQALSLSLITAGVCSLYQEIKQTHGDHMIMELKIWLTPKQWNTVNSTYSNLNMVNADKNVLDYDNSSINNNN